MNNSRHLVVPLLIHDDTPKERCTASVISLCRAVVSGLQLWTSREFGGLRPTSSFGESDCVGTVLTVLITVWRHCHLFDLFIRSSINNSYHFT